jgi:glycogen debranching enzyme
MGYRGLDDVERSTEISLTPAPDRTTSTSFGSDFELEPGERRELEIVIRGSRRTDDEVTTFSGALDDALATNAAAEARWARVTTSNAQFNEWLVRSGSDMRILATETGHGLYPYAGIPWFSTPFGRDGIIAALETLWANPDLAAGVLRYLARHQATEVDPSNDAQPGKILHETRGGEMAALGEHPFRRYYGSVDATPLFVLLAGEYYRATGNLALLQSIWPNIVAAIEWLDKYGDSNGDGFVDYGRTRPDGLINQGWKDSQDSIFHADGDDAVAPIARSKQLKLWGRVCGNNTQK